MNHEFYSPGDSLDVKASVVGLSIYSLSMDGNSEALKA